LAPILSRQLWFESLGRPGGNVTGITNLETVLYGKRLEILKESVPKLSHIAVLYDPDVPAGRQLKDELPVVARARVDHSALGDTSCGRSREGICRTKQEAP
jgi:ABC-type uncharacterized transport system substrate-binding protein